MVLRVLLACMNVRSCIYIYTVPALVVSSSYIPMPLSASVCTGLLMQVYTNLPDCWSGNAMCTPVRPFKSKYVRPAHAMYATSLWAHKHSQQGPTKERNTKRISYLHMRSSNFHCLRRTLLKPGSCASFLQGSIEASSSGSYEEFRLCLLRNERTWLPSSVCDEVFKGKRSEVLGFDGQSKYNMYNKRQG